MNITRRKPVDAERCQHCFTRHACIAAKYPADRLSELPDWFDEGVTLAPADHLYRAGDTADTQYHIRSGMFKTFVLNAQGDEFITGFHLPGEVIGVVQDAGRHSDSAVALDAGSACEFNKQQLLHQANPDLSSALLTQLGESARGSMQHQISLSQSSAQARFAAFCVNYAEKLVRLNRCTQFLPTPMSRTDLANYLGLTLESLSRVISKLNSSGVIRASQHQIEARQPGTLRTLARHSTL